MRAVVLTTEEEGVATCCGAWLGGERSALLMQSSGVGNCINMLSLIQNCRFPFLTLVTMRGEFAEFNPWQVPMARATQTVLEAMGLNVMRVDRPEEVADTVQAALDSAFQSGEPMAVLLSQRLIGRKKWVASK
jgi:sulfopyruvate decarboxylase alpha subunit